jgi:hypothetical protein
VRSSYHYARAGQVVFIADESGYVGGCGSSATEVSTSTCLETSLT